jgi:hypothetical protein
MFKIDFSSAISLYVSFPIVLVFILWLFYNRNRNDAISETKYLHQCPYCTFMFFNYHVTSDAPKSQDIKKPREEEAFFSEAEKISSESARFLVCPRCQSYINLDDTKDQKEP